MGVRPRGIGVKASKVRVTLDLSPALYSRLERLVVASDADSKSSVLRDAISLLEYVAQGVARGDRFFKESPSGERIEVVFLGIGIDPTKGGA